MKFVTRYSTAAPARWRIENSLLVVVLLAALVVRLAYVLTLPATLTFDEPTYQDLVQNLLSGHGFVFSGEAYFTSLRLQATSLQEPLYPLFLAVVYRIVGPGNYQLARMVQAFMNTATVAILMALAYKVWSRPVAIVVGLLAAVYLPFVYFTGLLMTENLYVLAIVVLAFLWFLALHYRRWWLFVLTGVAFGLACLTRGMLLYFLPVLLVVTGFLAWGSPARRISVMVLVLVGAILTIAPWTWRNYTIHHSFVPITTKGGYNLYIYSYPIPDFDFNFRLNKIPIPDISGLSEVQREALFRSLAAENITTYPLLQMQFALHKLVDFWNPTAEHGPKVAQLSFLVMFASISLFAVLGMVSALKVPETRWIATIALALILFHMAGAMIFTGGGKARLPVEPFLVLLAGGGLSFFYSRWAARWGGHVA